MKLYIDYVGSPDYSWGCELELIAHTGDWKAVFCRQYGVAWDSGHAFPPSEGEVEAFIEAVKGEFPAVEIINRIY